MKPTIVALILIGLTFWTTHAAAEDLQTNFSGIAWGAPAEDTRDLALARRKRGISTADMAGRLFVSRDTLWRLDSEDRDIIDRAFLRGVALIVIFFLVVALYRLLMRQLVPDIESRPKANR